MIKYFHKNHFPIATGSRSINLLEKNCLRKKEKKSFFHAFGVLLIAVSLGGITGPLIPFARLESSYYIEKAQETAAMVERPVTILPASVPVIFNPLIKPDGSAITPVNLDFSIIVPKVDINATIIGNVDPGNPGEYAAALKQGVAHASTSVFPDQVGTVYLFSHSTNYDWFVKNLNAVFYHLKNLESGDLIVVFCKGIRYTYKLMDKKVVQPWEITYLAPQIEAKKLILQTCWPPGSTAERLLLFADLIEESAPSVQ